MYKNNCRGSSKFRSVTRFNFLVLLQESATQSASILILTVINNYKNK